MSKVMVLPINVLTKIWMYVEDALNEKEVHEVEVSTVVVKLGEACRWTRAVTERVGERCGAVVAYRWTRNVKVEVLHEVDELHVVIRGKPIPGAEVRPIEEEVRRVDVVIRGRPIPGVEVRPIEEEVRRADVVINELEVGEDDGDDEIPAEEEVNRDQELNRGLEHTIQAEVDIDQEHELHHEVDGDPELDRHK